MAAVYPDKNGHTRQVTGVVANGGSTTLTLNKVASGAALTVTLIATSQVTSGQVSTVYLPITSC